MAELLLRSQRTHVDRLWAHAPRARLELDPFAVGQSRLAPVADDAPSVDEEIMPALIGNDEAVAACVVEPT
jgi:hypothetical protein